MSKLPSKAELHRLLEYNEKTGVLLWKHRDDVQESWNVRYAGKPALNSKNKRGYLYGSLLGKTVRTHRVIWKWIYGTEPNVIDHDNGIRWDNRKVNLNNGTVASNQKNTKLRVDNKSGHHGIRYRNDINKWHAYINCNGKQINLGTFDELHEAIHAREQADAEYGYNPNHGR